MPPDYLAGIPVHVQQFTVLKETAGISNAHGGRYATFASKCCGMLKNCAFLNDEASDAREQGRKMWMEDPQHKNRTCWNVHDVFGVSNNARLPASASRRGAQAGIDCR
jgi:hypothetical protein